MASAKTVPYLEVKCGDFQLEETQTTTVYNFILTYNKRVADKLPQKENSFARYTLPNRIITAEDGKKKIAIQTLKAHGDTNKLFLSFEMVASDEYEGFSDSITSFTIPKEFACISADSYINENPKNCQGIKFVEDMTFKKQTDGSWKVVIPTFETQKPIATLDGKQEYAVSLDGAMLAPVWDFKQDALRVDIQLPYRVAKSLEYTATAFDLGIVGVSYDGEVTFTQEKDTSVLQCTFRDADVLSQGSGITLTIGDTLLKSRELGEVSLLGSCTYYGYFGGEWLRERYFEVFKTVGNTQSVERLPIYQTQYVLPSFEADEENSRVGWKYNERLYKIGEKIPLDKNNRIIRIKSITVNYSVDAGASIRYDKNNIAGIRFFATLKTTETDLFIDGVGLLIVPKLILQNGKEFTYENHREAFEDEENTRHVYFPKDEIYFNEKNAFQLSASFLRLKEQNFNKVFCARGYVSVCYASGIERIYTENVETRSIYEVATNALKASETEKFEDWQITVLDKYVNSVANIVYDEVTQTAQNICISKAPIIEKVDVVVNAQGIVTVSLKTSTTRFLAVTYNGKRALSSLQEYDKERGVLTLWFHLDALSE